MGLIRCLLWLFNRPANQLENLKCADYVKLTVVFTLFVILGKVVH